MMNKTIASRLSARFQVDGSHLHRFLDRAPVVKKALIEDLILHDQIIIPIPDYLTADGLILVFGERALIELLEAERIQFVRTRSLFGFVRGKGKDGGLAVFSDPNSKRPQDCDLDESIDLGLKEISGRIKEKMLLSDLLLKSSIDIKTSEILEAVRKESIADFKRSTMWRPRFTFPNPDLLVLPGIRKMTVKVVGMNPDPLGNFIDTLLEIVSYNTDLFLADRLQAKDVSPYFPIGDLLRIKAQRAEFKVNSLWSLLEINGIPDFSQLDFAESGWFEEIHKVTLSAKAHTFRKWFHSKQDWTEKELFREYLSVVAEVPWTQKLPTRIMRFIVTSLLGVVPGVGQVASFVDSFLFDEAFRKDSPKFFIDDLKQLEKTKGLQQSSQTTPVSVPR